MFMGYCADVKVAMSQFEVSLVTLVLYPPNRAIAESDGECSCQGEGAPNDSERKLLSSFIRISMGKLDKGPARLQSLSKTSLDAKTGSVVLNPRKN